MTGQYRKKNAPRQKSSKFSQYLLMLISFIVGYLSASLYDLTHLTAWINSQVLANNSTAIIKKTSDQQAQLPKPKFEFYTLLANEQVVKAPPPPSTSSSTPTSTEKPLPLHAPLAPVAATTPPITPHTSAPIVTKDAYMVQVGSFKNMQEAEKMKVSLVIKGFDVKIATIKQQQTNWYRVFIGPFSSHMQAQQAQMSFSRQEHIMGMIRKMDA